MTSEEIIQRLLDEKHITAKEAMILLKDIIKNTTRDVIDRLDLPFLPKKYKYIPLNPIITMYACTPIDDGWKVTYDNTKYTNSDGDASYNAVTSINDNINDNTNVKD